MDACPDTVRGCFYPEAYLTPADFLSIIVVGLVIGVAIVGARFALSRLSKRRGRSPGHGIDN